MHAYPHSLGMLALVAMVAGFVLVRGGLKPMNEIRRRLADVQSGRATQVARAAIPPRCSRSCRI